MARHDSISRSPRRLKPRKRGKQNPNPSKLRTAGDVPRELAQTNRSTAEQLRISPTLAVREMRDGVPTTELRHIRDLLDLVCSPAIVVAHALREQNVELDEDAADVLRRHVSDVLFDQILQLNRLLGEDGGGDAAEDEDDDGGAA